MIFIFVFFKFLTRKRRDNINPAFTNNDMREVQYWSAKGIGTQNFICDCAGNLLYGGYGIFGVGGKISKLFNLPPHSQIKSMQIYGNQMIGNQEYIQIIIDEYIYDRMLYYSEGSQLCGLLETNENELIISIEISIPHTTELLNINILSTVMNMHLMNYGVQEISQQRFQPAQIHAQSVIKKQLKLIYATFIQNKNNRNISTNTFENIKKKIFFKR